jgi:hypothetical protein
MLPLRAVLAGSLLFATTLAAQPEPQAETTAPGRKSPTTARVIGIIPGAGHMYAGEVGRGFLYLGGTLGLVATAAAFAIDDCVVELFSESDCGRSTGETVSLIAAGGLWVWSIIDAGRAARRTNAKRAARTSLIVTPTRLPTALGDARTGVRLGVRISSR